MSYAEQIPHPDGALNPPQQKQKNENSSGSWRWWVVAGVTVLVLICIFHPRWCAKIGIRFGGGGMIPPANPMGWA